MIPDNDHKGRLVIRLIVCTFGLVALLSLVAFWGGGGGGGEVGGVGEVIWQRLMWTVPPSMS